MVLYLISVRLKRSNVGFSKDYVIKFVFSKFCIGLSVV